LGVIIRFILFYLLLHCFAFSAVSSVELAFDGERSHLYLGSTYSSESGRVWLMPSLDLSEFKVDLRLGYQQVIGDFIYYSLDIKSWLNDYVDWDFEACRSTVFSIIDGCLAFGADSSGNFKRRITLKVPVLSRVNSEISLDSSKQLSFSIRYALTDPVIDRLDSYFVLDEHILSSNQTTKGRFQLSGYYLDKGTLKINGQLASLRVDGRFSEVVNLDGYGEHIIRLEISGKHVSRFKQDVSITRLLGFQDEQKMSETQLNLVRLINYPLDDVFKPEELVSVQEAYHVLGLMMSAINVGIKGTTLDGAAYLKELGIIKKLDKASLNRMVKKGAFYAVIGRMLPRMDIDFDSRSLRFPVASSHWLYGTLLKLSGLGLIDESLLDITSSLSRGELYDMVYSVSLLLEE
jgi:hypothetical protein